MFRALALGLLLLGACDRKIAGGEANGPKIFAVACAQCHGNDGNPTQSMRLSTGVKPLTSAHVQGEMTDADIRQQILNGSANRNMPSFKSALTDAQVEAVVAHVRSLGK